MNRSVLARRGRGFTLIEMLVSLVLLCLISLLLLTITGQTSRMWRYTTSRSEQFGAAGQAFDSISQRLSQATLNTYWDYDNPTKPRKYQRQSQLRFLTDQSETLLGSDQRRPGQAVFFQAPLGVVDDVKDFGELDNLLNTWGYYLEYNKELRPDPIENMGAKAPPQRYRYRLMELMEPSNSLSIYSAGTSAKDWYMKPFQRTPSVSHVLAENVIQLVLLPRLTKNDDPQNKTPLSPAYRYDSYSATGTGNDPRWANQLPPVIQVTMVALDEASASRAIRGSAAPAFDALLKGSFTSAIKYDDDLLALQTGLANQKLNYRVFTTNVSIRGARWSRF